MSGSLITIIFQGLKCKSSGEGYLQVCILKWGLVLVHKKAFHKVIGMINTYFTLLLPPPTLLTCQHHTLWASVSLKNFITLLFLSDVAACQNVLAFSHSRGLSSGKSMRHDIEETNTSYPAVNDSNSQLWGFDSTGCVTTSTFSSFALVAFKTSLTRSSWWWTMF